jgi:hypothetical protein
MLSGLEGTHIKLAIREVDTRLELFKIDVNNDISNLNDNMTSVLYMLSSIGNNLIKDLIRDLGLEISGLRDELTDRITTCERKLEEHDNILANILSRLTAAGI